MVLKKIIRIIQDSLPGIYADMLAPREGVVVNVGRASKDAVLSDEFMPVYAVDVQLLNAAGEPDELIPVLQSLPLPLNNGGGEAGFYGAPQEGMKVVVSFIYGLPNKPYIQTLLPSNASMPGIKRGDMIWTQGEGISQSIDRAGNWKRETNKTITDTCDTMTTNAREQNENVGSRDTKVKGHWLVKCFGFFKVKAFGSVSIVSGARMNLSAAETLNLTSVNDLNINTAQKLTAKAKKKIDISTDDEMSVKAELDLNIETTNNLGVKATKKIDVSTDDAMSVKAVKDLSLKTDAKCYLGNDDVNLVKAVSDLADQVSKIAAFTGAQLYGGTASAAIPGNPAELAGPLVIGIKAEVDGLL